MTESQQLAAFVEAATLDGASPEAVEQLKIRVLDTVGVAIGALDAEPIIAIRELLEDLGGTEQATLIGGGKTTPERAAFFNSALSRYLDFMDAYLAKGETNHPSDNFGAVLAAAESVGASGKQLLTAFAVAYRAHSAFRCRTRSRQRFRPHHPGCVRRGCIGSQGSGFAIRADCQRLSHRRHRECRATRDPHRQPEPLERPCLPACFQGRNVGSATRQPRHHRPRRSLRRQQGFQGLCVRAFRNRLVERRPRKR